jgi:hypothetical protein
VSLIDGALMLPLLAEPAEGPAIKIHMGAITRLNAHFCNNIGHEQTSPPYQKG